MKTYLINLFGKKSDKEALSSMVYTSDLESWDKIEQSILGMFIFSYLGHDYFCKKAEIVREIS